MFSALIAHHKLSTLLANVYLTDLTTIGGKLIAKIIVCGIDYAQNEKVEIEADALTGALKFISAEHAGDKYGCSHDYGAVAASSSATTLIQCTGTKPVFLTIKHYTSNVAPAKTELFENCTFSAEGSEPDMGVRNLNRTKDNSSTVIPTINPTVSDEGDLLYIQGIAGEAKSGGEDSLVYPLWLLAPATDYLIRYTNLSNQDTEISIFNLGWYE